MWDTVSRLQIHFAVDLMSPAEGAQARYPGVTHSRSLPRSPTLNSCNFFSQLQPVFPWSSFPSPVLHSSSTPEGSTVHVHKRAILQDLDVPTNAPSQEKERSPTHLPITPLSLPLLPLPAHSPFHPHYPVSEFDHIL